MPDLSPKFAQAVQHLQAARFEQARLTFQQILRLAPANADANNGMAVSLIHLRRHDQAVFFSERAAQLSPKDHVILANHGSVLVNLGRYAEGMAVLRRALEIEPEAPATLQNLGNACWNLNRSTEGLGYLRRVLELQPDDLDIRYQIATKLTLVARADEAVALCREGLARAPDHRGLAAALATSLVNLEGHDVRALRDAHAHAGACVEKGVLASFAAGALPPPPPARDPDKPLRVGFVSPDFRSHSVAFFVEPLLASLDRAIVTPICYSAHSQSDAVTARLKPLAAEWRQIEALDDLKAAQRVRADRVDILVDLAGHTTGNRLGLFSLRPAPVQATYCGYPASTGLSSIAWRLVDSHTDPPGAGERGVTERLARLDPCFLCYRPPDAAPDVAEAPSRRAGVPTFGSFNATSKLSPTTLALWARLLSETPGSRLVLKSLQLTDEQFREDLRRRFGARGIDPARLDLRASTSTPREHLAMYHDVDVGLDPFPYHGTTTTCEAAWMGVPTITLAGPTHASRVGITISHALGAPELVASGEDEYVRLARSLAGDLPRLSGYRASLRSRLREGVLSDAPGHARRFERALREMWRDACDGDSGGSGGSG